MRRIPLVLAFVLGAAVAPAGAQVMQTAGRQILDGCGHVFIARGVEQVLGEQLPPGNDRLALVDQIAATGSNAVRVRPDTATLGVSGIDAVLTRIGSHGMVAFLTPAGHQDWLGRADVRAMLAKHERYLVIDAFGEPGYDDRTRFRADAIARVQRVREWGYRVPLTVLGNRYGRDLPSVLLHGQAIVDADPLHSTILGWQAYWGRSGYYQRVYGMSLIQGIQAASNAPFPIQLGFDRLTDLPSETMDYGAAMDEAQTRGIGWLWWDWYNPYGPENNLSRDGSVANLTPTGQRVVKRYSSPFHSSGSAAPERKTSRCHFPPPVVVLPAAP